MSASDKRERQRERERQRLNLLVFKCARVHVVCVRACACVRAWVRTRVRGIEREFQSVCGGYDSDAIRVALPLTGVGGASTAVAGTGIGNRRWNRLADGTC